MHSHFGWSVLRIHWSNTNKSRCISNDSSSRSFRYCFRSTSCSTLWILRLHFRCSWRGQFQWHYRVHNLKLEHVSESDFWFLQLVSSPTVRNVVRERLIGKNHDRTTIEFNPCQCSNRFAAVGEWHVHCSSPIRGHAISQTIVDPALIQLNSNTHLNGA